MKSVNPHSGETIKEYREQSADEITGVCYEANRAYYGWRKSTFEERGRLMKAAGQILRERKSDLARLMALEMGKVLRDGVAEVEKCANCCDFFADHAKEFLSDRKIETDASDSHVAFDPIGVVLAVMPWNFPFWQVIRFAAPSLMAGNVGILKHASNVSGCALALEEIFASAGFPRGVFSTVLVSGANVEPLIRNPIVKAVTLTGSTPAGRSVAAIAGSEIKKSVLELGGSDAYVVLDDCDLDLAVETCVKSRLINVGQSCISAKRFIVVQSLYQQFEKKFVEKFQKVKFGDPLVESTQIGPLARVDLRDEVHDQVKRSVAQGASLLVGGIIPDGNGAYYPATVLGRVSPGMAVFDEEIFGPVAALVEAKDEKDAICLANSSVFGLGAALFTKDKTKAEKLSREIEAGSVFVNALVKSDQRLPFGGVKQSGYGRELSSFGIHEFVNIKTIYHAAVERK